MCGIAFYIGSNPLDEKILKRVASSMKERGPDHQGYRSWIIGDKHLSFVHSRLSIIDLGSDANQPFSIDSYHLIYNGEIYNYIEVREELKKLGCTFRTNSDTEVLLRSYIQWGNGCLEKLEGMWSFVIYNESDKELFIARDRFGEKPLYFTKNSQGLFFASQTKTLQKFFNKSFDINELQIKRYLCYGYKALYKTEEDYFENVFRFPSSHYANISISGQDLKFKSYWKAEIQPNPDMTQDEAVDKVRSLLFNSISLRLRSDVPMAFCLSGGIDSASLVSIVSKVFSHKVHCFSIIDSDERYNEEENIDAVIKDTGAFSHKIHLKYGSMKERMQELVNYHNAPVATISYLVHSMLSESMHKDGFKVAFSGTSADEIFTGYYDHFNLYLYEMRNSKNYLKYENDWLQSYGKFVRNPYLKNPKLYIENPNFRDHIYLDSAEFESYLRSPFHENYSESKFSASLLRNRMLNELLVEATPIVLNQDDLNSMKYSIENRSPFLDRRLIEFSFNIPDELLIAEGYGKYLLRKSVTGILTEKVLWDKRKKGFNASVTSFFDFNDQGFLDYLLDPKSRIFDFVERDKIEEMLGPQTKSDSLNKFIFYFISVKMFLDSQD